MWAGVQDKLKSAFCLAASLSHEGMIPRRDKRETDMNYESRELNDAELETVAGGGKNDNEGPLIYVVIDAVVKYARPNDDPSYYPVS